MNLDERARRAADDIVRAMDDPSAATPFTGDPFERFERTVTRRTRNQRVAAVVVASGLAVLAVIFVARTFSTDRSTPAAPLPSGPILYGEWDQRQQLAHWYTVKPDGSERRDLHLDASCAAWFPDGTKILISNDAARGQGSPLRPAVIEPDGSGLRPLDGTHTSDLELGCGDVSPDGTRIVVEGFNEQDRSDDGIYSIRASDGGGLRRLTTGLDGVPQYSPDGSRVVFLRTKAGVLPDGAGALFVVGADGTGADRITPWGAAFLGQAWSPDGRWIAFQRPYGRLFLVHPDGSDLHEVPLGLPSGSGARQPSWSPDGAWIVFSLTQGGDADLYAVRPDGTELTRLTESAGSQDSSPDWGP
jgi:Tol biopolymer transport system component